MKKSIILILLSAFAVVQTESKSANKIKPAGQEELVEIFESNSGKIIVVEFFAEWCGFCKMFDSKLEEIAKNNPDIVIVQLDVDKFKDHSQNFGVQGMPTTFLFEKGKEFKPEHKFKYKAEDQEVDSVVGADQARLEDSIAVLKGNKKASDIKAPARPKMPEQGPLAALGGPGMMIEQMIGQDLAKELGDKLPKAVEQFMKSKKLNEVADKLASLVAEVVEEIVASIELSSDVRTKLSAKLGEAKKSQTENFNKVKPMIEKMNPDAMNMASTMNNMVGKVLDRAKTAVENGAKAPKAAAPKAK